MDRIIWYRSPIHGDWNRKHRLNFISDVGMGILKKVIPSSGLSQDVTVGQILTNCVRTIPSPLGWGLIF